MKANYRLIGSLCANKVVVRIKSSRKKHSRVKYIIMTAVLPIHQVTGSINFPADKPGRILRATDIYTMSNASGIVFGGTILADFHTSIGVCNAASTDDYPALFKDMNNKAQNILGIVQNLANATPARAISILHSCGFNAIPAHGAHVKEFGAVNGTLRGTVDMVTAGGPHNLNHLHIWWVSLDGITWSIMRSTNKASVTLTGFAHAKDVYFKTQLSIQDVLQTESNIIMVLVN